MKNILTLVLIVNSVLSYAHKSDSILNVIDTRAIYLDAFEELEQMLKGEIPLSFKRAVFVSENAFMDGQLSYDAYLQQIESHAKLVKAIAAEDGLLYTKSDRAQVLLSASIFRALKDTIHFNGAVKQFKAPYKYDLDDFWGEKDWTKMFVTKLLATQSGNCHSLPALYEILSNEVGVQAWLSMAPNHTYIKQWSDKTGWYNTELTTGTFPFDAEIKWNSYIKNEAIAEGVYMDTLSSKETIAYVITDLAQGYVNKFKYDDLDAPMAWLDRALSFYPDYLNALLLKAELSRRKYQQFQKQNRNVSLLKVELSELERQYTHIHELGYRKMPKEMYLNWLFRVNKDTTRTPFHFRSPQPFQKYNYTVSMITAGDGQNLEFYDEEEVVTIGSAKFNRVAGKIVNFIESDTTFLLDNVISRMYDPALGRWWQIDPEAEGYNNKSPYNYANNDPISNVDPDGQDWYRYSDKDGNESVIWKKGNAANVEIDGQKYNNIGAVFANQAADGSVVIYNQNEVFAVIDADAPAGDAQENAAIGAMQNPEGEHHFDDLSPGMETLFFASDAAMTISAGGAYSSRRNDGPSGPSNQKRDRQVQIKLEDLNSAQKANLKRAINRIPANSKNYQLRQLGNGNIQFTVESPGKVPGSKALYVKEVDNTGTTVKMYKVTTDPAGNFVHNKNKLSDY